MSGLFAKLLNRPLDRAADSTSPPDIIREAFWIVLAREISPIELREQLATFESSDSGGFIERLLSSPEFRLVHAGWHEDTIPGRDPREVEAGLATMGSSEAFVSRTYDILLGRAVDPDGLRHALHQLTGGATRSSVVRGLVRSEEFADRYRRLSPEGGFVPRDVQLCELANPAKWDNPDWMAFLRDLKVLPDHKLSMHRKGYEFTQLVFGLDRLGRLREDVSVLSVGAGHECVLYWLANRVGSVIATDLYGSDWQAVGAKEGDERVVHDPASHAPFPYRQDRLIFLKMDGQHLAFRRESFDVVYSLSSVEHFGGLEGAIVAIDEMARVLKPGGLLVVATEYRLAGPSHDEVFSAGEIHTLLARPGLELVQPIDEGVYRRYDYRAIDLYGNRYQTPHMVVHWNDTVFTSVMAFLTKR